MATFSTNQARQIYVATKEVVAPTEPNAKGEISLVAPETAEYMYFKYVGPDTPLRSDLITKDLVMWARLTNGKTLQRYLHQYNVTLDSDVAAAPVAGQQYLLRINMLGYASLGIENTYQKYGYVKATKGMTASQFYAKMAQSLALNYSREPQPIYQFFVSTAAAGTPDTDSTLTEVKSNTDLSKLTGTYTRLVIREVSGVWKRGTDEDMPQMAQIFTDDILVDGLDQRWGKVEEITDTANLTAREDSTFRQLADLEYFYMGERADKYRNVGWPYVISTEYMIDALAGDIGKDASKYGVIDIHYAYVGSNESVQKSEKDCTIILPYSVGESIAQKIANAGVKISKVAADGTITPITPA